MPFLEQIHPCFWKTNGGPDFQSCSVPSFSPTLLSFLKTWRFVSLLPYELEQEARSLLVATDVIPSHGIDSCSAYQLVTVGGRGEELAVVF